ENDATALGFHTLHEKFFVIPKQLTNDSNCDPLEKKQRGAKDLCNNVVHFLKEIAKKKGTEQYQLCSYLPYWLYAEIAKFKVDNNAKISTISFIKELTEAVKKAKNGISGYKCNVSLYDANITLDEWKIRKFLYIYFKKFDELSRDVNRTNNDKCSKHNKYLNSINSLYKTYYTKLGCGGWFWSIGPDYFPCSSSYNPNKLLPKVTTCKDQSPSRSTLLSFLPFWGSSSSSHSSSSSQASTGNPASSDVPKDGPSKPVAGSVGGVSAPGTKLNVVKSPRPVGPATVGRLDATGTLNGRSAYPNQLDQLLPLPDGYPGLPTPPEGSASSFDFLKKTRDILKSDYFRHSVMGVSVIGVLIFFYFYFSVS
ncbi:CYIR protein, partial [Plasmodium cynomolgi strain B]